MITIDNREHECIAYCKEKNVDITIVSLEVGDMIIEHESTVLIFERKTMADLAASIKDGRFREQKQRLKQYPFHRITYIIEGNSFETLSSHSNLYGISTTALQSALFSLAYRDGFHVIYTSSIAETMTYLFLLHQKMIEHPEKIQFTQFEPTEETYLATLKVKSKKIENITPSVCFTLQLSQIPGISTKLAKDIMVVFPTISQLLVALQEKGAKALVDVPGIGLKKAKTIYSFLLQTDA